MYFDFVLHTLDYVPTRTFLLNRGKNMELRSKDVARQRIEDLHAEREKKYDINPLDKSLSSLSVSLSI